MRSKQLSLKGIGGWGGRRKNSGRKNRSGTVNHMRRPTVSAKHPLHITMRLRPKMPNLRRKYLLNEFLSGITKAQRKGLRVLHFSLQSNHLHMLAEADSNRDLSLGMQSLASRLAKIIRRHGANTPAARTVPPAPIFAGRYHLRVLRTPHETKNVLRYVLLNSAKHSAMIEHVDLFSSATLFKNWAMLLGRHFRGLIRQEIESLQRGARFSFQDDVDFAMATSSPRSWLAAKGWARG